MQPYDFESSVSFWIIQAAHAIERAFNEELAPHGITMAQSKVLGWLAHDGALSQAELAERMRVEPPTLAGILDRMERDGWLERFNCPNDRRKKRIRATEKAESVWARMVDCAHRVRVQAREGLSQEDLDQLRSICARIRSNLEEPAPAAAVASGVAVVP